MPEPKKHRWFHAAKIGVIGIVVLLGVLKVWQDPEALTNFSAPSNYPILDAAIAMPTNFPTDLEGSHGGASVEAICGSHWEIIATQTHQQVMGRKNFWQGKEGSACFEWEKTYFPPTVLKIYKSQDPETVRFYRAFVIDSLTGRTGTSLKHSLPVIYNKLLARMAAGFVERHDLDFNLALIDQGLKEKPDEYRLIKGRFLNRLYLHILHKQTLSDLEFQSGMDQLRKHKEGASDGDLAVIGAWWKSPTKSQNSVRIPFQFQ